MCLLALLVLPADLLAANLPLGSILLGACALNLLNIQAYVPIVINMKDGKRTASLRLVTFADVLSMKLHGTYDSA